MSFDSHKKIIHISNRHNDYRGDGNKGDIYGVCSSEGGVNESLDGINGEGIKQWPNVFYFLKTVPVFYLFCLVHHRV